MKTVFYTIALLSAIAFTSGCATQVTETPSPITPAKERLGNFERVVLAKTKVAPTYQDSGANIKAVNKIDRVLETNLSSTFTNLEVVSAEEAEKIKASTDKEAPKTLVIQPYVKQIKFIGGAARFWGGAMAGSSVVIMDTAFTNANTGEQIANPGYYRRAGAYTDAFGTASNSMLNDVAIDISNYVRTNM